VLREDVADWFELDVDSPYMLQVANVVEHRRKAMTQEQKSLFGIDKLNVARSEIPAVTHVDYSARIQTVHRDTNPRNHALLSRFKQRTGCPVVVNTSFNVRGADCVHAGGRIPVLYGNGDRDPHGGQLLPAKRTAGFTLKARLQKRICAGLREGD
jgi:predicted NodU family carbamoyl transferase